MSMHHIPRNRSFDSIWSEDDEDKTIESTSSSVMYQVTEVASTSVAFTDLWRRVESTPVPELSRRRQLHSGTKQRQKYEQESGTPHERRSTRSNQSPRVRDEKIYVLGLWVLGISFMAAVVAFCGILALYQLPLRFRAQEGSLLSIGAEIMGSASPSTMPSQVPSLLPSISPTSRPSSLPSIEPTATPTLQPSSTPSSKPSISPSSLPTSQPSSRPTSLPSATPSSSPSASPTSSPSSSPSAKPSRSPTASPTSSPSASPTSAPSSSPTDTPIIFYVMGDVPYSDEEAKLLMSQVRDIPNDAEFVVHVGDINKAQDTNCTQEVYSTISSILRGCRSPVLILPGDNDIMDCPSPFLARFYWTQTFRSFENKWRHSLNVRRPANNVDNFSFFLHNVLFLGVDITGSGRYRSEQRSWRLKNELEWVLEEIEEYENLMTGLVIFAHASPKNRYKEFARPLAKKVRKLGVPSLYIHGNGHKWEYRTRAFKTSNLIRVQVDRGGRANPLRVRFRGDAEDPFEFDRRK